MTQPSLSTTPDATELMRMALAEAGRPDMAEALSGNSLGNPAIGHLIQTWPDEASVRVAARAGYLAHRHAGTTDFWPGVSMDRYVEAALDHPWRGDLRSGTGLWGCILRER